MVSPTALKTDQGYVIDHLCFCPWDVRRLLEDGIRRFQSSRILMRLPDGGQESCWRRALRVALQGC
eukprot:6718442-Pyramimonas_sp.AAC.1